MTASPTFVAALSFVLEREGGYTCDPRDPGGETNFGICKREYPGLDIKVLTRDRAAAVYLRDYWQAGACEALPAAVAFLHFDACVNQGKGAAAKMLQQAAGVEADGAIGPKTLAAVQRAKAPALLVEYAARRALRYATTDNLDDYGLGWMRRLMACLTLSLDHMEA